MVGWYNKKPVHLLSSLKSTMLSVMRKVKGGPGVGFLKILVRCPSLIWWFNKGMGGIKGQASAASAAEWASAWNPKMASLKAAGSCFILSR